MKQIAKYFAYFILVITIIVAFSSCSKNNFASRRYGVSSMNPVSPKYSPVRKKFIINYRRRPILGLDKRR